MGTERLRFLRGGSVVRPHVMPFNLEWMKNINQKYIHKLPKAFTLYFTSLYLKGFACSVLTEIFKNELVLLTLLTLLTAFGALGAVRLACCVLTENLRGKI